MFKNGWLKKLAAWATLALAVVALAAIGLVEALSRFAF